MALPNTQPLQQLEATPSPATALHPNVARLRAELERSLQEAAFGAFHFQLRMHALKMRPPRAGEPAMTQNADRDPRRSTMDEPKALFDSQVQVH